MQEGAVGVADYGGSVGVVGDRVAEVGVGFDGEARDLEGGGRVADGEVAVAEVQD